MTRFIVNRRLRRSAITSLLVVTFTANLGCASPDLKAELVRAEQRGLRIGIAFTILGEPTKLITCSSTGKGMEELSLGRILMGAQFTRDGRYLVGHDWTMHSLVTTATNRIIVIDSTGRVTESSKESVRNVRSISYSPASKTVAFAIPREDMLEKTAGFYLLNLLDQKKRFVRTPSDIAESPRDHVSSLSWRYDSQALAYSFQGKIWTYDVQSAITTAVGDGLVSDWSPTAPTLAYLTKEGDLIVSEMINNQRQTRVAGRNARGLLAFSPDGKYLLTGMSVGLLGTTHLVVLRPSDGAVVSVRNMFKGIGPDFGWIIM